MTMVLLILLVLQMLTCGTSMSDESENSKCESNDNLSDMCDVILNLTEENGGCSALLSSINSKWSTSTKQVSDLCPMECQTMYDEDDEIMDMFKKAQKEMKHNEIEGLFTIDSKKCSGFEMNRANLVNILDPHFMDSTGINILVEDDVVLDKDLDKHHFEISISMKGLDPKLWDNGFQLIKKRICDALPCEEKSEGSTDMSLEICSKTYGIDLFEFTTLYTSVIPERIDNLIQMPSRPNMPGLDTQEEIEVSSPIYTIPWHYNARSSIGPIRSQNGIKDCQSFAVDGVTQYYYWRDKHERRVFSTKYYYYQENSETSHNIGDVIKAHGMVQESEYPHKNVKETGKPGHGVNFIPEDIKKLGKKFVDQEHYKADDEWFCVGSSLDKTIIKAYIKIYGVGFINFDTFDYDCFPWRGGTHIRGGHAVVVDGYDNEGLSIRNSWGTGWCNNGFTFMPWKDVADSSHDLCFWKKPIPKYKNFVNLSTWKIWRSVNILGCDGIPNSGKVKDVCGLCGGDGSSCTGGCKVILWKEHRYFGHRRNWVYDIGKWRDMSEGGKEKYNKITSVEECWAAILKNVPKAHEIKFFGYGFHPRKENMNYCYWTAPHDDNEKERGSWSPGDNVYKISKPKGIKKCTSITIVKKAAEMEAQVGKSFTAKEKELMVGLNDVVSPQKDSIPITNGSENMWYWTICIFGLGSVCGLTSMFLLMSLDNKNVDEQKPLLV